MRASRYRRGQAAQNRRCPGRTCSVRLKFLVAAVALLGFATSAQAAERVNFILNWVAGGDHAPYYYAQKMGWYKAVGIDLNILQGKGSSLAAEATGAGIDQLGLADFTTVLVALGKG